MIGSADPPLAAAPAAAARIFGDRLDAAVRYADLLATRGITEGLLGPREATLIWDRHLLNSAALSPLIPTDATAIDIGSGAGLPGLALALARPDLSVVLLEPMARRARFLRDCLTELSLHRVEVVGRRAQDAGDLGGRANTVTARAVAPLHRLIPMALPLLRPGGSLLALKGRRAADDITQARRNGVTEAIELLSTDIGTGPATVVRVRRSATERGPS